MEPRLKSSKKWTKFPTEFEQQIADLFKGEFAAFLKDSRVIVSGRIYPKEILLRVGFLNPGSIKQHNFEVSAEYDINKDSAQNCINDCVDMAASLMATYIDSQTSGSAEELLLEESEENDLPRIWKEFQFNKKKIFGQYSTVNTDLEEQANQLLGLDEEELVNAMDDEDEDYPEDVDGDDDGDSDPHLH